MSSEEGIYEIKEITDARWIGNGWEYFVRWKEYDDSENSWVPEKDFDSSELINKFWKEHDQSKYLIKTVERPRSTTHQEVKSGNAYFYYYDQFPYSIESEKEIKGFIKIYKNKYGKIFYLVKTTLHPSPVYIPSKKILKIAPNKTLDYLESLIKIGSH